MSPELDQELCEKYPKLFSSRKKSPTESCMFWGFEHGDGWYSIIDQLCDSIQNHIDWRNKSRESAIEFNKMIEDMKKGNMTSFDEYTKAMDLYWKEERKKDILKQGPRKVPDKVEQVVVEQVKEKFGTLRFYYSGGDEAIDGMVRMAESMSSVMCEECGKPGEQTTGGWIRTLCEEHRRENE